NVRLRHLRGIAWVNRAVLPAFDPHLLRGVVAEDDVFALDAERFEIRPPDGRGRVEVQDARDPDLQAPAALSCRVARPAERPADLFLLEAAENGRLDLLVVDERAVLGHRLRGVEAPEHDLA